MIIFIVFIVIESGFIFIVIRVHKFTPLQVEAILNLTSLESEARYSVDSKVLIF
jgi:hypothetical protein